MRWWLLLLPMMSMGQVKHDKAAHFGAGLGIGLGVGVIHKQPRVAFYSAVASGMTVGFLKEMHDVAYGNRYSGKDFLMTSAGAIVSGAVVYCIKHKRQKRLSIKNRLK